MDSLASLHITLTPSATETLQGYSAIPATLALSGAGQLVLRSVDGRAPATHMRVARLLGCEVQKARNGIQLILRSDGEEVFAGVLGASGTVLALEVESKSQSFLSEFMARFHAERARARARMRVGVARQEEGIAMRRA
jgi:hypothetical protein